MLAGADPEGFALPIPVSLTLLGLLILGAALWIGGMVAVTILSITSRGVLAPADRTRMFHRFGRVYFAIAGAAVVVAAGCGLVLLIARGWDGLATAICVLVGVLAVTLAIGVRQARAMRRLRTEAAERPGDADAQRAVAAAARWAASLRGLLGLLSAAVFVLALITAG